MPPKSIARHSHSGENPLRRVAEEALEVATGVSHPVAHNIVGSVANTVMHDPGYVFSQGVQAVRRATIQAGRDARRAVDNWRHGTDFSQPDRIRIEQIEDGVRDRDVNMGAVARRTRSHDDIESKYDYLSEPDRKSSKRSRRLSNLSTSGRVGHGRVHERPDAPVEAVAERVSRVRTNAYGGMHDGRTESRVIPATVVRARHAQQSTTFRRRLALSQPSQSVPMDWRDVIAPRLSLSQPDRSVLMDWDPATPRTMRRRVDRYLMPSSNSSVPMDVDVVGTYV